MGVPDSSPQAFQESLFLHLLFPPPTTCTHLPTTATSPPSTLWKVLNCCPAHVPTPRYQPCSWLRVTPDKLSPPPDPSGSSPPWAPCLFCPLPSLSPREQIPPMWTTETPPREPHSGGLVPDGRARNLRLWNVPHSRPLQPPIRVFKPLVLDPTCPPRDPAEDAIWVSTKLHIWLFLVEHLAFV